MVGEGPHKFGTPSWMELSTPDPDRSTAFYGGLLGWGSYTYVIGQIGEYTHFTLPGQDGPETAGMLVLPDDSEPASWTAYLAVSDVRACGAAVQEAGGQVIIEPIEVAHLGRAMYCTDPQGTDFALWEPRTFFGAMWRIDSPGTVRWVELPCQDVEIARRFYGEAFGWECADTGAEVECRIDGAPRAGLTLADRRLPIGSPPSWLPHFTVADCAAAVARAEELGGRTVIPPAEEDRGRTAVVADPTGAALALVQPRGR